MVVEALEVVCTGAWLRVGVYREYTGVVHVGGGDEKQLFEKQFGHKPPIGNGLGLAQQPAADFRGDFSAS